MPAKKRAVTTRPATRRAGRKVRVAIIGVGNCASSLVQGVYYYRNAKPGDQIPGIMHVDLGGYHLADIEFVAAFDVDKNKVGKDLADAIYAKPNNTYRFADVPRTGVKVSRGMTLDGLGKYLSQVITKASGETDDIVGILKQRKVDVVVSSRVCSWTAASASTAPTSSTSAATPTSSTCSSARGSSRRRSARRTR